MNGLLGLYLTSCRQSPLQSSCCSFLVLEFSAIISLLVLNSLWCQTQYVPVQLLSRLKPDQLLRVRKHLGVNRRKLLHVECTHSTVLVHGAKPTLCPARHQTSAWFGFMVAHRLMAWLVHPCMLYAVTPFVFPYIIQEQQLLLHTAE